MIDNAMNETLNTKDNVGEYPTASAVEYLMNTYRPLLKLAAEGKTNVGPKLAASVVGINRDELRARCIARPETVDLEFVTVGNRVKFPILPLVMRMSRASADAIFMAIERIRKWA